jgi:hypothetical protein
MDFYIDNYHILDWEHYNGLEIWARDVCDKHLHRIVQDAINLTEMTPSNRWRVGFTGNLLFLRRIYSGPTYFNTIDEAKECIDAFLSRVQKLKAFW